MYSLFLYSSPRRPSILLPDLLSEKEQEKFSSAFFSFLSNFHDLDDWFCFTKTDIVWMGGELGSLTYFLLREEGMHWHSSPLMEHTSWF